MFVGGMVLAHRHSGGCGHACDSMFFWTDVALWTLLALCILAAGYMAWDYYKNFKERDQS